MKTKLLKIAFLIFLLSPFGILFFKVGSVSLFQKKEFFQALFQSSSQAFLSASLALGLGVWGALGLRSITSSVLRKFFEFLGLLPSFLPALFIVLSFVNFSDSQGLWPVVFVHTLINAGFCSVLLARIMDTKLGPFAERAYSEGSSQFLFLKKVALSYLRNDLLLIFISVFSFCFTSFTVVLMVGGVEFQTLETLIYEKIKVSGLWHEALFLSLAQSFFLISFLILLKEKTEINLKERRDSLFLKNKSGILVFIASTFIVFSDFPLLISGYKNINLSEVLNPFLTSLFLGLSVGALTFFLLSLICFLFMKKTSKSLFFKFLSFYIAPSTAVLGFSFLLLFHRGGVMILVAALVLSYLTHLYRIGVRGELEKVRALVSVSYSLGASSFFTFKNVVFPRLAPTLGFVSGCAGFWASGDFGLSSFLLEKQTPLSILSADFLSRYRLDEAIFISWIMVALGFIIFLFWRFLGHEFSQKSLS